MRWKRFLPVNRETQNAPKPPVPGGRRCLPRFCGIGKERLVAYQLVCAVQPLLRVKHPKEGTAAPAASWGSPEQREAGCPGSPTAVLSGFPETAECTFCVDTLSALLAYGVCAVPIVAVKG